MSEPGVKNGDWYYDDHSEIANLARRAYLKIRGKPEVKGVETLRREAEEAKIGSVLGERYGLQPALVSPFLEALENVEWDYRKSGDDEHIRVEKAMTKSGVLHAAVAISKYMTVTEGVIDVLSLAKVLSPIIQSGKEYATLRGPCSKALLNMLKNTPYDNTLTGLFLDLKGALDNGDVDGNPSSVRRVRINLDQPDLSVYDLFDKLGSYYRGDDTTNRTVSCNALVASQLFPLALEFIRGMIYGATSFESNLGNITINSTAADTALPAGSSLSSSSQDN